MREAHAGAPRTTTTRFFSRLTQHGFLSPSTLLLLQVARPLVQSDLGAILDFRLIPFGNARPAPPPPPGDDGGDGEEEEEGAEEEEGEGEGGRHPHHRPRSPHPPPAPADPYVCQHGPDECTPEPPVRVHDGGAGGGAGWAGGEG